jgi:hypothetical protein
LDPGFSKSSFEQGTLIGVSSAKLKAFSNLPSVSARERHRTRMSAGICSAMNELGSGSRYQNHFHCSRSSTGRNSAAKAVEFHAQSAPKLANWLEDNIQESLTVFST